MGKRIMKKVISSGLVLVLAVTMLTGCRFGFASDPDDPNEETKEVPIDTSVDTFEYDTSLGGTSITLLNSKAEIQVALEKMGAEYEKKSGVHVEVMPVTDGDSPYTKVVSLYNSGTPPTASILDTTDVIALAEEKAADLTEEPWVAEAEGYLTEINGKIYSFPLCIEGRGIIYNKAVIEEALGESFDPASVTTQSEFVELLDRLVDAGIKKPVSMAKEDWSLGAHQLQYIYETYEGTSEGAQEIIEDIKAGNYPKMSFCFRVAPGGDHYEPETHTRVIDKIEKVYDVSPVAFPANPNTELNVSARSYFDGVIKAAQEAERLHALDLKRKRIKTKTKNWR